MTTAMEFAYDQKAFVNHSVGEILFLEHIKKLLSFCIDFLTIKKRV